MRVPLGAALRRTCLLLVGVGALPVPPDTAPAFQESPDVAGLLRGRVEALRGDLAVWAAGDRLLARQAIPSFYEERGFEPAWIQGPTSEALLDGLTQAVHRAAEHGLDPRDYHLDAIENLRRSGQLDASTPAELVDLELLASDAFLVFGSHLHHGRVNPETVDPEWLANRRSAAMHAVLADAVTSARIEATLMSLAPHQPRYRRMVAAASQLRATALAGGWPEVPVGPKLEIGDSGGRVDALRARLVASADLIAGVGQAGDFDEPLAEAVRRFQSRHGLDVDGVVGAATIAALNVSAAERLRQVEVNLERWRWLPTDLGERHLEVNIAGFDVKVVERGRTIRVHRAVVGRQYRQTPMFSGVVTYLVLSPYWHVPPTIAAVDKLPAIKVNPGAIAAQRMTLLDQVSNRAVDPASVDWAAMSGSEFNRRYRLRQDPGPSNALGAVKFMFPNRHNVYLHDTPTRELFDRTSRGFSSGCIRVQDALDLATYLLSDQEDWSRDRIDRVVGEGVERTVRLTAGVPVHLLYWTAWADENGVVHFRDDIYGRDRTVWRALEGDPPGA
jgi:murein L,D-transpeptidase YcbB/YkuD